MLDVGCGTGDYAELVTAAGGDYVGVDFAPAMVDAAQRRVRGGGPIAFAAADGTALPLADGAFDVVLALGYVAYFADPRPALREIHRVLRGGGTLIAQTTKPDLLGALDRAVVEPLRRLRHGRRQRAPLPPGWVNVRYSGRALDRLVRDLGFRRVDRAFNHFHAMPAVLRHRHPSRAIACSEWMNRHPGLWRALAVNYIGKYLRDGGAPAPRR